MKDRPINHLTDWQTGQHTDMRGHREVIVPMRWSRDVTKSIYPLLKIKSMR